MRVGIITFHCSYNYGSALQTHALKRFVESQGHTVQVIHFLSPDFFRFYQILRPRRDPRNTIKDVRYFGKHVRRARAFRQFWRAQFDLTRIYTLRSNFAPLNDQFDAFISGGDQIWNLDCTHGIVGPFFLDFATKPKIAYAPSLSARTFDQTHDLARLRTLLDRYDHITIREAYSVPWLQAQTARPVGTAVDPAMLLEAADYERIMEPFPIAPGSYIFYYELREESKDERAHVVERAERDGLSIVYFTEVNPFGERGVDAYGCTPGQWLYLLQNAALIISNSFHATVFALCFGKPFVVIDAFKSVSRMEELLTPLGLSDHIYRADSATPMADMVGDFDVASIRAALRPTIARSKDDLIQALKQAEERA